MNTVLIVDDDINILKIINEFLKNDYQIKKAINGKTALKFIAKEKIDLIVVDWMLPDISGVDIISWVRNNKKYQDIPIIMLTAKANETDKIKSFAVGSDDYLVKPFLLSELKARIKSLLRRTNLTFKNIITLGEISINKNAYEFKINANKISLSKKEFKLLELFIQNPNKIYSREKLLNLIWDNTNDANDRIVDVCISRLRKSLKDNNYNKLITIRGVGYKLEYE